MAEADATAVRTVQLDALVAVKILKHCRDALPTLAMGQLLGLDVGERLEVTNCFAVPNFKDEDAANAADADYQMEMMRCLRDVNVDNNAVGWYQSTYLGSFVGSGMLESQFTYQTNIAKSVVIVYDPFRAAHGTLALRAFRLSAGVMALMKDKAFTIEALNKAGVSRRNLFEEVPITIRNSALVNAFVTELEEKQVTFNFDQLELTNDPFLEKNLEFMIECTDEFSNEQYTYQTYQRQLIKQQQQQQLYLAKRKFENGQRQQRGEPPLPLDDNPALPRPAPEPSRLETLLVSRQIDAYCRQVNQFAGHAFSKLFLTSSLQ